MSNNSRKRKYHDNNQRLVSSYFCTSIRRVNMKYVLQICSINVSSDIRVTILMNNSYRRRRWDITVEFVAPASAVWIGPYTSTPVCALHTDFSRFCIFQYSLFLYLLSHHHMRRARCVYSCTFVWIQVVWQYSNLSCSVYPLSSIDSIGASGHTGPYNDDWLALVTLRIN